VNNHRAIRRLGILAALMLVTSLAAAQKKELVEALSYDGLKEIKVKGIDMAYALPGATLSGYKQVMIDPVNVLFAKNWDPKQVGSRFNLGTNDIEKIRSNVAKLVYDTFIEELKKGGYNLATAAGPDVLEVRPGIINLYITAPDTMTPGRSRVYTTSAGEMTLVAELADSETGQVIARVLDRYRSRDTGNWRMSSGVDNASEARSAALSWAKILRDGLDKAKSIGSN
jgi:hypothetical protein